MIFFSVGMPGRFTEWCDTVVTRLIERALGPVAAFAVNTIDEFARVALSSRTANTLILSRHLGQLQKALADTNQHFVLALEDPRSVLGNLVLRHNLDFMEALRVTASTCAAAAGCLALPGALVVRAQQGHADPSAIVAAIARHLDLGLDDPAVVEAVADLGAPEPLATDAWWNDLPEPQQTAAAGALDAYATRFAGGELGSITWERDLFLIDEEQPADEIRYAVRPVDVTGRARHIVYGPYITLPPGAWSAAIILGFSEEAADLSYTVSITAGAELATLQIEPERQQMTNAVLDFSIAEPLDLPIEMLVSSERAAFDGVLALGHVILTPRQELRPETRNFLAGTVGA